jgi:hypothetical protein
VKFDQVKKKSFDQMPNLTENFDQVKFDQLTPCLKNDSNRKSLSSALMVGFFVMVEETTF